jgi:predicted dehydrogenase
MIQSHDKPTSRREFLKTTGQLAAVSALAGVALPHVHAAEKNTIKVALIGCGGRGGGAAVNALSTTSGPIKLVALADVFEHRLNGTANALNKRFPNQVSVPKDRQFIGFDAYKHAMDCLEEGDVAIFASPPAFRWVHFDYALKKGINVFMEKPITVDGPTSKKMFKQAEEADRKNLKVGVGLMVRHCKGRIELFDRIQNGEIGEIIAMRAYRMHGPAGFAFSPPKPDNMSELLYQVQRFHSFLWASGGLYSDFYIHQVDECCWMKNAWPVSAHALGGRHYREGAVDQNLDTYSVEYTFADGTKFFFNGRTMGGCHNEFSSFAHGSKGMGIISTSSHAPGNVRTFKGHKVAREDLIWGPPESQPDPYQLEWDNLIEAIRQDKPFNELKRGVEASIATSMGRMAAHTGQIVTWDEMLNCEHEFAPDVDKLTMHSSAPLQLAANGIYPVPAPGVLKNREY